MVKKTLRLSRSYTRVLAPLRNLALKAVALASLAGLLEGTALLFLIPVINHLAGRGTLGDTTSSQVLGLLCSAPLYGVLTVFFVLALASPVMSAAAQNLLARLEFSIVERFISQTLKAALEAPWPQVQTIKSGEIEKATLLESQRIGFGARQLLSALANLVVALILLLFCSLLSPLMTAATLLIAALGTLLYFRAGFLVHRHTSELRGHENRLAHELGESIRHLKFFRLWDSRGENQQAILGQISAYADIHTEVQRAQNRIRMIAECAVLTILCAFLVFSVSWLGLDPGRILVFLGIFYRLVPRLLAVNSLLIASEVELRFLSDFDERLKRLSSDQPQLPPAHEAPAFQNSLEFDEVNVNSPSGSTLLRNVSFSLARGQMLAIVGESGAGKTTLLDALCGLYPVSAGRILVDKVPLTPAELPSWRENLAVVLQQTPVLAGTLLQNVAWGDKNPDRERALKCIKDAQLSGFLEKLPQGLETILGQGARTLSGGEAQRLGIARALFRGSPILILDEPTSALDAEAESELIETIRLLKGQRTIILVTHRLRAATIADQLLVLADGEVIERGLPAELLKQPGSSVARLHSRQSVP